MSTSCTSGSSATHVSAKPWFLTFNEETRDVFVWKNGIRLQLKEGGESAGGIRSVSIRNVQDKTIYVSSKSIGNAHAPSNYHFVHSIIIILSSAIKAVYKCFDPKY